MKPGKITTLARSMPVGEHAESRFLLRWVSWEAFAFRTLVVLAHRAGWSVSDAEEAVDAKAVSGLRAFRDALEALQPGLASDLNAEVWERLEVISSVRHKLVHGSASSNPRKLDLYSNYLTDIVKGTVPLWTGATATTLASEAILARLTPHRQPRDISELHNLLEVRQSQLQRRVDIAARIPRTVEATARFLQGGAKPQ